MNEQEQKRKQAKEKILQQFTEAVDKMLEDYYKPIFNDDKLDFRIDLLNIIRSYYAFVNRVDFDDFKSVQEKHKWKLYERRMYKFDNIKLLKELINWLHKVNYKIYKENEK
jgi:hypothetical protein